MHVRSGEFYTNKRTPVLTRKKGDSAFQNFGRAAQEIATNVSLDDGDMVLRSEKTGTEILRLKQKPETTYEVVIENAFIGHQHMTLSVNHFQYYYQLLAVPRAEWFEFRPASRTTSLTAVDSPRASFALTNYILTDEAPCMPAGW